MMTAWQSAYTKPHLRIALPFSNFLKQPSSTFHRGFVEHLKSINMSLQLRKKIGSEIRIRDPFTPPYPKKGNIGRLVNRVLKSPPKSNKIHLAICRCFPTNSMKCISCNSHQISSRQTMFVNLCLPSRITVMFFSLKTWINVWSTPLSNYNAPF